LKKITYLVLISIALMSMAMAQDFVKGWEPGQPINLSGIGKEVFEGALFQGDGWFMDPSNTMTPSMAAFAKNNPSDGKPLISIPGAFVGAKSNLADPRNI